MEIVFDGTGPITGNSFVASFLVLQWRMTAFALDGAAHVDLHDFAPAACEARIGGFLALHMPGRGTAASPGES